MLSARAYRLIAVVLWMSPALVSAQDVEQRLIELHRELVTSQMVEQDPSFLLRHSHPSYRVLAPGGVLEDRDQVIAGLRAFARIDSVPVSREHGLPTGRGRGMGGYLTVAHTMPSGGRGGWALLASGGKRRLR